MKVEVNGKTYCVETLIFDNERLRKEVVASAELHRLILDEIKAEIESQRKEVSNINFKNDEIQAYYDGLNDGLKDARDILDKYRAESEDKE